MRLITIVGARPQFIKAAAVSRQIDRTPGISEILVHTGQHYDKNMSDVFFRELDIPRPDYNLGVGSGTHGVQTAAMLQQIEGIILDQRPDWVLVYGDTNSTLAGALAAAKLHVPVGHVEAGLRSFNRRMPEEINRVVTDHISDMLFAPTESAVANLRNEGITGQKVQLVGDVMYDAALYYRDRAASRSRVLEQIGLAPKAYVLVTIHRADNTDNPERLRAIMDALTVVGAKYDIVFPVHPRTHKALAELNYGASNSVRLIPPVGYLDMVKLEQNARLVVTDSGGVQKEAFFFGVPCITLREETEWTELVELGWNTLASPDHPQTIVEAIMTVADSSPGRSAQPFGTGDATERILRILMSGGAR